MMDRGRTAARRSEQSTMLDSAVSTKGNHCKTVSIWWQSREPSAPVGVLYGSNHAELATARRALGRQRPSWPSGLMVADHRQCWTQSSHEPVPASRT